MSYLLESNILGILAEALSAHVESVFTDQTMAVTTHTAENIPTQTMLSMFRMFKYISTFFYR